MSCKSGRRYSFFLPAISAWWVAVSLAQLEFPSDAPSSVPSLAISAIRSDMPSLNPSAPPGAHTIAPSKSAVPSIHASQVFPSRQPNGKLLSSNFPSKVPTLSASPTTSHRTHAPSRRFKSTGRPSSKPTFSSLVPTVAALPQPATNCTISQGFLNPICIQSGYYSQYACFDYRLFASYIASAGCIKPIKVRFNACSESQLSRRLILDEDTITIRPNNGVSARVSRGLKRRPPRLRTKSVGPKGNVAGKGPKGPKGDVGPGKKSISNKIQFAASSCSQTCVRVDEFLCLRASSASQTAVTTIRSRDSVIRIAYTVSDASGVSKSLELGVRVADSPACYNPSSTCSVSSSKKSSTRVDGRRRRKGIKE